MNKLNNARIIDGICWVAFDSFTKTQELFETTWGHQPATKGTLNYNHFTMGMDVVFHTGSFAKLNAGSIDARQHYPHPLTESRFPLPEIAPGLVVGRVVENSYIWQFDNITLLLQSCSPGKEEKIIWEKKGKLKRQAAATSCIQLFLPLDDWKLPNPTDSEFPPIDPENTFIILHSYDPNTNIGRVFIGKSRLRVTKGESSWEWLEEIYVHPGGEPRKHTGSTPSSPTSGATLSVADATVHLKKDLRDKDVI